MFLHLGGDILINGEEIVAIMDIESSNNSVATKDFLKNAKEKGFIQQIGEIGKEKTFVVTNSKIFLSPISSFTLKKRAKLNNFELNSV